MIRTYLIPALLGLSILLNVALAYGFVEQSVALTHHKREIALRQAQVDNMEAVLPTLLRQVSPADVRAVAEDRGVEYWDKTHEETIAGGVSFAFEDGELRQLSFD